MEVNFILNGMPRTMVVKSKAVAKAAAASGKHSSAKAKADKVSNTLSKQADAGDVVGTSRSDTFDSTQAHPHPTDTCTCTYPGVCMYTSLHGHLHITPRQT